MGAIVNSQIIHFPMKGKIARVQLSDGSGRFQNIHYLCDGPIESEPVFLFEGDSTQGYANFLDIQRYLKELGRRSCIYDRPGLGYSDFIYKDQKRSSSFFHNFLMSIGEKRPYVLVGLGEGGSKIYEYATNHPEMVKSLTFLDVFPEGIEFTSVRDLKNLTRSQFLSHKKKVLRQRKEKVYMFNTIGVPWGFVAFEKFQTGKASNKDEISFWMKSEKMWLTQSVVLDELMMNDFSKSEFDEPISENILVNLVITKHDDHWVIKNNNLCISFGADSEECTYEIESNRYYIKSQENVVQRLNGGSITYCTEDDCSQSYYTIGNPKYTADLLDSLY